MKRILLILFSLLVVGAVALSACQPAPVEAPEQEVIVEEVEVPVEVTRIVEGETITETIIVTATAEPEAPPPEGPQKGGTYVITTTQNPDTLDIQKSTFAVVSWIVGNMGGSLITFDLEGNYIPYLAESWEASEDGLKWTFHLRDDVYFHNGDPLTANDWVYTYDRALSEDFVSPVTGDLLAPITSYEAVDDYTLVLGLDEPFFPIMQVLTIGDYIAPYNQRAVEEGGDAYGWTSFVSVGPMKLESFILDDKVTLTRNEDYNWGPADMFEGANTGPYYIDRMEFRIIPDYSTQLAAFLAGEIHAFGVQPKDLAEFQDNPAFNIYSDLNTGYYYVIWNEEVFPFDDVLVRQAFSHVVDKQVLCDVTLEGRCLPIDGYLSPAQIGYCDAEDTGLHYDLEKAKELIAEAGFEDTDGDGIVEKDGQPLSFVFKSLVYDNDAKFVQILIEMWKEIGADVTIEQYDWPSASPQYTEGDYVMGELHIGWPEADMLMMMFHSSSIGGLNFSRIANPELDALLEATRTETDPDARKEAVCEVQRWLQQDAPVIPLMVVEYFIVVDADILGTRYSSNTGLTLQNAYFAPEE